MNSAPSTTPAPGVLEEPFFFELAGESLFGFLHRPTAVPRGGIVFCHAFAEEKLWSHRVYVGFAREAAAAGYAVLRFDMRGEGDSSREFEDTTLETRIEDVGRAVQELRQRIPGLPSLILVGHRLGGSIAAAAAVQMKDLADGLVIWDPIVDGADYFGQLLRSNLTTQMATEGKVSRTREALIAGLNAGNSVIVDGYGLTAALYRGIASLQLSTLSDAFTRRSLIIEIAKGEQTAPSAPFAQLAASRPELTCSVVSELPFWRETRQFHKRAGELTRVTLQWLEER
jgi:uncharacterized protein